MNQMGLERYGRPTKITRQIAVGESNLWEAEPEIDESEIARIMCMQVGRIQVKIENMK